MFYQTDQHHGLPHNPFKSCVAPRPIAWVSSISADGTVNLAPFSFFNAVASDPPMVMISFNGYHSHGGDKDSLANIKDTREFVVNVVSADLTDAMNTSCGNYPPGVNEFQEAGLRQAPSRLVRPPRVEESPVNMECKLERTIELPCTLENSKNELVLGRVIGIHIQDEVLTDGLVDLAKVVPLARLGYMQYSRTNDIFTLQRPVIKKD